MGDTNSLSQPQAFSGIGRLYESLKNSVLSGKETIVRGAESAATAVKESMTPESANEHSSAEAVRSRSSFSTNPVPARLLQQLEQSQQEMKGTNATMHENSLKRQDANGR